MALLQDIATAVAARLNAAPPGTFAVAFTAVRAWRPVRKLPDAASLHVTVLPGGVAAEAVARDAEEQTVAIHVLVQQRPDGGSAGQGVSDAQMETACDGLVALTEALAHWLRLVPLTAGGVRVYPTDWRIDAPFDADDCELRLFTSLIALTYQVTQ